MSDDEERIDVETDDVHDRNSQLSPHLHVDKRAHHNALERKRRDHIKDSFHHLRDTVPHLEGEKISRAQILNKATDFIKEMRHSTSSSEADIEDLRRSNVVLEEQVKALEEVKSNGGCDENIDTLLVNAEKRAIEKLNSASKGPSRTMPHSQLVGGMAGPHDMKPTGITGSGLVLNALTTSRGLSQLVNSVTPSDHSYTSVLSGLPGGTSTAQFKPDLAVTQPSAMKSNVRSSLAALTSTLRSGSQPLSLSTSTTVGAQTHTRNTMPFAVGQQSKVPSAVMRGVSPVIVKTPPAVTSSSLPRGIVTATAVPPMAHSTVPQRTSSSDQKLTSVAVASTLLAPNTVSSASSALLAQPSPSPSSSSSSKTTGSNVLQTLLAANPLELNTALQNLLLTAANSSSSTLTDAQKTLISTLVAITSSAGGSADSVTGPGGAPGGLAALQMPQSSTGPVAVERTQTGAEADKVTVDPSPEEGRGAVLDPHDLLNPPLQHSSLTAEEEVDVLGEDGDLPPAKRPKQE